MWQGALRAFEALAITEADLDDESGRIQIRHGKGDKQATIRMAGWAWPFLNEWRELRRDLPNPRGPLLCVIDGRPRGAPGLPRPAPALKAVAVGGRRHQAHEPHQLRHAFAVHAYEAGMPLRAIQLHLRHENIGITDTYLQGLGVDESLEQRLPQAMPTVVPRRRCSSSVLQRGRARLPSRREAGGRRSAAARRMRRPAPRRLRGVHRGRDAPAQGAFARICRS
jgi:integrase